MAEKNADFTKVIFNVAWLAIALGLAMELLVLLVAAGFGKMPGASVVVSDSVQKVSWSFFVCTGVALGTVVSRLRGPLMGLAGLIAAPVAFTIAKVMHKSTTQALAIPLAASVGPSPILLAVIKGFEYAALGLLLGYLGYKLGFWSHILIGLGIGLVFGGAILFITFTQTVPAIPFPGMVSRGVNEIVFPMGCALVLFTATQLGLRMTKG